MRKITLLWLAVCSLALSGENSFADGMFVFHWNKKIDINEPTQKAIILHDQGREDLVLQVKYEGPAEEFGWLIPVPALPEVSKGSMDCFYELSKLTQERLPSWNSGEHGDVKAASLSKGAAEPVHVVKIETVGAYEVAILAAGDAGKLADWLDANGFAHPKDKQTALDGYIKKHWYFVAVKIDPEKSGYAMQTGSPKHGGKKTISSTTRKQLANGELHPLVISFAAEKCIFPLAVSAGNGKPSEVSLYILSAEPLMNRAIFDKKFADFIKARRDWISHEPARRKEREERMAAVDKRRDAMMAGFRNQRNTNANTPGGFRDLADDPADPMPPSSVVRGMTGMGHYETSDDFPGAEATLPGLEVGPRDLTACVAQLPRLADKKWWLVKQVQTFAPAEMWDLEFEPAIPVLTAMLRTPDGCAVGFPTLKQFGARAVPAVLAGMKSSDPEERLLACKTAAKMKEPALGAAAASLVTDESARTREAACYVIENNWDDSFAPRLVECLSDPNWEVRGEATVILRQHPNDSLAATYRKLVADDTIAAGAAVALIDTRQYSRPELLHFFQSTNLAVVSTAFTRLRGSLTVNELAPLLTNSLPLIRLMGLGELGRIGDKPAGDRMVALLRDPNEMVQWRARAELRRFTGQKLGADPAAYEKWWKENRESFVPQTPDRHRFLRQSRFETSQ